MNTNYIDLNDIQGNIVRGYGRYGYPFARYVFFEVTNPIEGRHFLQDLIPYVVNGSPWRGRDRKNLPRATTNIAFSYEGLKHLGIPVESLHSFPDDFSMGMKARATILGDNKASAPEHWDPIWHEDKRVHIFVSINAQTYEALEERYTLIQKYQSEHSVGVSQLFGHRDPSGDNLGYQEASAVFVDGIPTAKEHFGYTDGISDPYFKGSGAHPANVIGGGKPTRGNPATEQGWQPIETGEFILGYRDETQELPPAPTPRMLSMNGTFMVYRKLHQNVGAYKNYVDELGKDFPGGPELLSAKITGRWKNGAPLVDYPTKEEADAFINKLEGARKAMYAAKESGNEEEKTQTLEYFNSLRKKLTAFNYNDDIGGGKCPLGAHMRRANPRGALEHGVDDAFQTPGALVDRRRILRRGLPYGKVTDPNSNDGEHGIIFMTLNASINRQFEFVQQQWVNYGNDFKLANEKDPLIGNQDGEGTMTIHGTDENNPPFFCPKLPRFVETRGGEYFFIPSISALRMIAEGLIDPT